MKQIKEKKIRLWIGTGIMMLVVVILSDGYLSLNLMKQTEPIMNEG